MPSHQERREPLPKCYQFGDAARPSLKHEFTWKAYGIRQDGTLGPDEPGNRVFKTIELMAHWKAIEGWDMK